ncbi:MAG TPA: ATP-binding cassette domain-containing protein [Candidatus Choladousia intestinigallinarum]|nr:ATP-binding cassette domain-containing protein [Candidatus Choladousia intestinigallinarum]
MPIQIENLCKAFGDHQVLLNFSAEFPQGETTCIMGPSGIGKTTLLRLLMGLEKPDQGEILGISGKRISAVFQEDRLCGNLTAAANVRMTQRQPVRGSREFAARMEEGFKNLGLEGCESQRVWELSGGMRRRVSLLRALLAEYEILFLDEPFKGLDLETREKTMAYAKKMCRGKTVICVTHDREEALAWGGKICLLAPWNKDE